MVFPNFLYNGIQQIHIMQFKENCYEEIQYYRTAGAEKVTPYERVEYLRAPAEGKSVPAD